MIPGWDSSLSRPSAGQLPQLRAWPVRLWGGYLATRDQVGLESPWDLPSFDVVRQLGAIPLAFCSGWDDPLACRQLSSSWRVRLCLDVEPGIRGLGFWTQGWLDTSGAGVYGDEAVHASVTAPFHVAAFYPTIPQVGTWPPDWPHPGTPTGWQSMGTHQALGLSVDSGFYDDWFGGGTMASVVIGSITDQDPRGHGAVYLVADPVFGPKRWVPDQGTLAVYSAILGQPAVIDQYVLDRMEELEPVGSGSYLHADVSDVQASIAALAQLVQQQQAAGGDPAVKAELDRLSQHLGLGTA